MALVDITIPDIGDFDEVSVIELLVKPGDTIQADQSLITVESDKASMEIPSSQAGVVKELKVKLGDKVKQGSVVLLLEAGSASAPAAAPVAEPKADVSHSSPAPEAIKSIANLTPSPAASGPVEVRVPDIGDFKDVAVIEVLVKVGDSIKAEQSLVTVESDKASMEIPSSAAGVVKELMVKLGDKLNIGDLLVVLEGVASMPAATAPAAAAAVAPAPAPAASASAALERVAPTVAMPAHEPAAGSGQLPHASPSVRKFARELGVPLPEVKGTGPKGRITLEDVQGFTQSVMAGELRTQAQAVKAPAASGGGAGLDLLPWPKVDFTKFGPVERKDMSRIKKISGANLHRNWVMIPHVTQFDESDVTDLEQFRVDSNAALAKAKSTVKLTMLAFVIKASVAALKKYPAFNASIDATGANLILKQYYSIGFAADTPNGLMVPVVKDADQKSISQIATEMAELSAQAREGKLSPANMQGATFTISSLGGIGGTAFTPIINAPEVAILGLSKSSMKPVWDGAAFQPRLMLPLSLSYDHRVIDGAMAARFTAYLAEVMADLRKTLL